MADSFFVNPTDSKLVNGTNNFAIKIAVDPVSLGLTASDASGYAALNTVWQEAYLVAITPETRTKSSVRAKNDARRAICQRSSLLAQKINGTATVSDPQKIDLGLSVRETPKPVGLPGTPYQFIATMSVDGSLDIGWKCKNGRGVTNVMYQVYRRAGATGELIALGATGQKRFVDSSIPAGTTSVMYQVQAIRTTGAGVWAQFNVNFGNSMVSMEEMPMKVAA